MEMDLSSFDHIHTQSNIFGGQDIFDSHGGYSGHTQPNIFGGQDFFDSSGIHAMQSTPNIFGGVDIDPLQSSNFNIPNFSI